MEKNKHYRTKDGKITWHDGTNQHWRDPKTGAIWSTCIASVRLVPDEEVAKLPLLQENKRDENVKEMTDLTATVPWMLSEKWDERLKAETIQARIRLARLYVFLDTHKEEDFETDIEKVNYKLMVCKSVRLAQYLKVLENRCKLLKIDIDEGEGKWQLP